MNKCKKNIAIRKYDFEVKIEYKFDTKSFSNMLFHAHINLFNNNKIQIQ